MSTSTYTDVNITRARAIAKRARQYGYQNGRHDGRHAIRAVLVTCPECSGRVEGWLGATDHRAGSISRALDGAMVEHLTSGDCTAHPVR